MAIEKIVTAGLGSESSTTSGERIFLSHYIHQGRLRHWALHVYGHNYELGRVLVEGSGKHEHHQASISTSGFGLQEYQQSLATHYSPTVGNYFYIMMGWTALSTEEIDRKCHQAGKTFGSYAPLTNNCHDFLQSFADKIVTNKAPDWK